MRKGWPILFVLIALGLVTVLVACADGGEDGGRNDNTNDYDSDDDSEAWHIYTIDSEGNVGAQVSIDLDSNDKVHISYYACLEPSEYECLKHALKYATNASGEWQTYVLDSEGMVASFGTSIAVDSKNKVHIAYHDNTNGNLKYTTNSSGEWEIFAVDTGLSTGMYPFIAVDKEDNVHIVYSGIKYVTNASGTWQIFEIEYGHDPSIAVDPYGNVHLAYDSPNGIRYTTNKNGNWQASTIQEDVLTEGRIALALDSKNNAHITYYDSFDTYNLMYATNVSGNWTIYTIDSSMASGDNSSIKVDSRDNLHISYQDIRNGSLKYATNTSGAWQLFVIDSVEEHDVYNIYTSIAVDSDDNVHIAYYDYYKGALKYATNRPPE